LVAKQIFKFLAENYLQISGFVGPSQAACRFLYQEFDFIKGDAAVIIEV